MRRNKVIVISLLSISIVPLVAAQLDASMFRALDQLWAIIEYFVSYLPNSVWAAGYYKFILWIVMWAVIRKVLDKWPLFKEAEHH